MEAMIYGRDRNKFQKLFPNAIFEGYECSIRFAWFFLKKETISKVENICYNNKIKVNCYSKQKGGK